MFGRPDPDRPGTEKLPDLDLVRLAAPGRVYTNTHLEYVADVAIRLRREPTKPRGVRIVYQALAPSLHSEVRSRVTSFQLDEELG